MNEQQQSEALQRWLDAGGRGDPPDGVDPDVLAALWALRPELMPRARLTADDILADVATGPFATTGSAEPASDDADVVPFPVPSSVPEVSDHAEASTALPRRAIGWGGLAGVLAAAAAVLLVVGPQLGGGLDMAPEAASKPAAMEAPEIEEKRSSQKLAPAGERSNLLDALRDAPRRSRADGSYSAEGKTAAKTRTEAAGSATEAAKQEAQGPTILKGASPTSGAFDDAVVDAEPPPPPAPAAAPAEADAFGDDGAAMDLDELDAGSFEQNWSGGYGAGADAPARGAGAANTAVLAEEQVEAEVDEAMPDDDAERSADLEALGYVQDQRAAAAPAPSREVRQARRKERIAEAEAIAGDWRASEDAATVRRLDDALAAARTTAATDPLAAAASVSALIAPPVRAGMEIAHHAAGWALAAGDATLALDYVRRGLALGGVGPERAWLLDDRARAKSALAEQPPATMDAAE